MEIFKNTDTEFRKLKIRDICQVKTGKRDANEQSVDGIYPFFTCGKQNSKADFFDFDCEAILIAGNGNSLGFTQYYEGKFTAYQRTYVLKDFGKHNPKYLYYYIKFFFLNRIKRNIQGAAVNYIRIDDILDFEIDYPICNSDVEKIADFLLERESYLQSIQTLISKMEQRNQYYFDKIFLGDYEVHGQDIVFIDDSEKEKINLNRKDIEVNSRFSKKKIPEMISLKKGGSIKKEDFNYEGNGVRYLRTSDVWEESSSKKEEVYYEGDNKGLVFKTKNDWIVCFDGFNRKPKKGTLGLVTNRGEGYCSGELHMIEGIEGVSTKFVNIALLRSSYFQDLICRYGEGTTVKHAGKHVKTIELPYIPHKEQLVLDSTIKKMLNEVDLLKQLYSKEKQVFQWLCEKLVSGEYKIED